MRNQLRAGWQDCRGTAAIEFALIASFLLVFLAVVLEIVVAVSAARDTNRVATQIAIAISATCADTACVGTTSRLLAERHVNFLVPVEGLTVTAREITKENGQIVPLSGEGELQAAIREAAQRVMSEGDIAVVAEVSGQSIRLFGSFLPSVAADGSVRAFAVAIRKASVILV